MATPIKCNNNNDNILKYKPFDETAMKKLQNDLQPFLKDKNLISLKTLIQKNETYSVDEIENILFTNIKIFKPITHHRMRDFVRRRLRIEKKQNVDGNIVYQSDDSNFVSPYSRDSFSSKSDVNMSPNVLNNLKKEIINLWNYEIFQKEMCQLLWNKGDLKITSNNKISLNFEDLKPSTLLAMKELINDKNKQLQNFLSNDKIKFLHDILLDKSMNDDIICEIYKLIKKREQVVVDENGKFSVDFRFMKPETITDLISLLRPDLRTKKKINVNEKSNMLKSVNQAPQLSSIMKQNKVHTNESSQESHQNFDIEKLRYLSSKIKECAKNERISDIFRIISENEPMDQNNGTLNVKKMKPVTLCKLFDFITANNF